MENIDKEHYQTEIKNAEERFAALADQEQRWRIALESAGQGLWDVNLIKNERYYSSAWKTMRGFSPDTTAIPNHEEWWATVHPDDKPKLLLEFAEREQNNSDNLQHEYRQLKADGTWVWIMSRGKVGERNAETGAVRLIGTDVDISELKRSESELTRLTERYEMATNNAEIGVWEYDLVEKQAIWDENTRQIFGVGGAIGKIPDDLWQNCLHPTDREHVIKAFDAAALTKKNYAIDYRIVLPFGEIRHVRCRAGYRFDEINGPRVIGVIWDITEDVNQAEELRLAKELAENHSRKIQSVQRTLEHNALHDPLTGLPNRRKLDQALNGISIKNSNSTNTSVALLHIDLDRFKQINDTMGHVAGDAILQSAAAILNEEAGDKALVSRIGGDEFVILFLDAPSLSALSALATRLLQKLSEPVIFAGVECLYGASIGIAIGRSDKIQGRTLLVNSDIALYQAKTDGRNRFCFFTDEMQQRVTAHKKCADDIKRGLERNEFFAVYQPQFDVRDEAVIGMETLVRWRHPERGILSPDAFLSVAENINAVAKIDQIVLELALADLAKWRKAGLNIPHVSVNVSGRRLGDVNLIETLRELDIPENSLSFELLESIFLDNQNEIVARNLSEIKAMGIGIEIDDFGTGHASIACLLSLRPKRLKIDRELVQPIVVSVEIRRLLASIVDIGQALGIEVLAEGVETMQHARILQSLDCNFVQGFAFAKPMEADAVFKFLKEEAWRKVA